MARTMYDSTNPYDIPQGVEMVAGYVDGLYRWPDAGWAYHKDSVHVQITVDPFTSAGQVLDVETGDAAPAQVVPWVVRRKAAGVQPSVYCNAATAPAVAHNLVVAGHGDVRLWIAEWTGAAHMHPNAIATQYADSAMTGHHYDLSLVADYWPGVDAAPTQAPPPPAPGLPEHEVQVAWAKLGDVLGSVLPSIIDRLALTGSKLGDL